MKLENIHRILSIKGLWVDITCNHHFIDYKVVHTQKENPHVWCCIIFFFHDSVLESTLQEIFERAHKLCEGESITHEIRRIYGMKELVLS